MVVHQATAVASGSGSARAEAVIVRKPEQLPAALGQRTQPVVIEDAGLERMFSALLSCSKVWFIGGLIAALVALAIERGYKIDASLIHDWKIERTEGKITLTPR